MRIIVLNRLYLWRILHKPARYKKELAPMRYFKFPGDFTRRFMFPYPFKLSYLLFFIWLTESISRLSIDQVSRPNECHLIRFNQFVIAINAKLYR